MCIKEAMRIYSPVPLAYRDTTEDMTLDGYFVPKGTYNGHFFILHLCLGKYVCTNDMYMRVCGYWVKLRQRCEEGSSFIRTCVPKNSILLVYVLTLGRLFKFQYN